ncbi:MAG: hypothetical protein NT080_04080 [Spirochaetes bacterium]|nr:hypothetical protein [Spirochaetota bacterium]
MDALSDLTWIKHLYSGIRLERFDRGGYRVEAIAVPDTARSHNNPYHFRLFFFDASATPVMAINLETDILGETMLTVQSGARREVMARFDDMPSWDRFRSLALEIADGRLQASSPRCVPGARSVRKHGTGIRRRPAGSA